MATITFDQTGNSAGVTDRARSDGFDTGADVQITVSPDGGTVVFVDVPPGDTDAVSSLTQIGFAPDIWEFTPTAGVYGTWLVQYTDPSSNVVRRAFSVRTPNHGLRIPAFNEKASQSATIATGASYIAVSDDNEDGTYDGWSRTIREIYEEVEEGAPNLHAASHQNGGSDEIAVTTPAANAIPKALPSSGGRLHVGWTALLQDVAGGVSYSPALNTLLFVPATANAITINLPAGHIQGDQMLIKLNSVATFSVTIDPNGSETIDGASTLVLTTDFEWAWLISNGINWFQIG